MTRKRTLQYLFSLALLCSTTIFTTYAQDKNFYLFLCFGQSNMESTGKIDAQDTTTNASLLHLEAGDCLDLGRKQGEWYEAKWPLCHCNTGVSPAEPFGKPPTKNMPDSIMVALI